MFTEVNELLVSQLHSVPIEEWQSLQKEVLNLYLIAPFNLNCHFIKLFKL